MIMCKELNAKEFFKSIPEVDAIAKIFSCGLEANNAPLSIAAANELLTRGYPDLIKQELKKASEEGSILARRLTEKKFPSPSIERTVFENIILSAREAAHSGR